MTRPFTRSNDGREQFDKMKNPRVVENWADGGIMDHGLLYNSPDQTGKPLLQPHSFTPVAASQEAILNAQMKLAEQNESENSGYKIYDNTMGDPGITAGSGEGNLSILTADDESPPAGDTGTISNGHTNGGTNGATQCDASDCILWLIGGFVAGHYLKGNGG